MMDMIGSGGLSEDYDYDAEVSIGTFYWSELSPMLVLYSVAFVVGLIGNSLIIYVTYRYRRMQSVTNVLLSSLASADLLLIVFCIPVKVAKLFSFSWAMGAFLCKFIHYIQNVSMICSVLTLTAISIERYYAIVHPMRAKYICTLSQVRIVIAITWVVSFLLAVPILFVQKLVNVGERIPAVWCIRDGTEQKLVQYHELYVLILVLIGPFFVMLLAYALICWEVWKVMERRSYMTSRHALARQRYEANEYCRDSIQLAPLANEEPRTRTSHVVIVNRVSRERDDSKMVKQVICMLVAVVLLFAICWGPLLIDNVLTAYEFLDRDKTGHWKHIATAFHLMAYFNSCLDPIIYGFMSKSFRDSFSAVLCCTKDNNAYGHRSISRMTSSVRQISRTGSRNQSCK